ncbi:MAG: hypothetical protein AB7N80_06225 [Bdellovibrionales bacterium]
MSRVITVGLWTLAIGVSLWGIETLLRRPPDTQAQKLNILKPVHDHQHRTAKMTGPLQIRLDLLGEMPKAIGDTYRVAAVLVSEQDLDQVQLNWHLGQGVTLISGTPQEQVRLTANEEFRVEAVFRAETPGAQRVQMRAKAPHANIPFAVSAHFNSQPEERTFRSKMDQLQTSDADSHEAESNAPKEQKIFH